jgi:hypothetical protein
MKRLLGMRKNNGTKNRRRQLKKHSHPPPSERIPFPDIYKALREKNKMDIALYEWSKSIQLVRCDTLDQNDEDDDSES